MSELREEHEDAGERYLQEKERELERMVKLHGRNSPKVTEMEKAIQLKKKVNDGSLLEKAKEVQNKISRDVTLMKQRHKVEFILPDSIGRDLEWTGLDFAGTPVGLEASNKIASAPKDTEMRSSNGRPDTPYLNPTSSNLVASTPRVPTSFVEFEKVFQEKTQDDKYVNRRPDQSRYRPLAARAEAQSQVS